MELFLFVRSFFDWAASATSLAALVALWYEGDVGTGWLCLWAALAAGAAYCQFLGATPAVSATGLALQTLLAVGLLLAVRLPH